MTSKDLFHPVSLPARVNWPGGLDAKEKLARYLLAMQASVDRHHATLSHVVQILGQYRVIIGDASERPTATGSGVLFLESDTALAFWDDPDTSAWIALMGATGGTTKLATTNFDDKLSAADDDVQKAMDTLDDHNHDADYLPAAIGGVPTAGHLTELAPVAVPPPAWALVDSGVSVADLAPAVHTHVESDITDLDHYDATAIHDDEAGEIHAITEKETPVNDDEMVIEDSAATWAKKRVRLEKLWAEAPAVPDPDAIHVDEANEISGITEKVTPDDDDLLVIEDSAAAYVKKKLKIVNLPSGTGGGLSQAQVLARGLGA